MFQTVDPVQEYQFLLKLCEERERYMQFRNGVISSQMNVIREQKGAVYEGRPVLWIKNCIGYLLKTASAQFIDPTLLPTSSRQSYEELVRNSAITRSVIEQQYAGFPQPTPQQTHQFGNELNIIQDNYQKTDLTGERVIYQSSPQYSIAGDPLPPPPEEKGAMDWLEKGVGIVGDLVSVGAKLFEKFA